MHWTAWAVETQGPERREVSVLVAAEAKDDQGRSPVMVNLVLDRSGSMKGAPLAAAVEAVQQLVELARPDDFLGLVLFDHVVEQPVPLMRMDARGKRLMAAALQGVQTGKGTALHGAVELAFHGLQRTLLPGRRPRLLILTDGEPSHGPVEEAAFVAQGEALAAAGVSVHALGLAKHYVAEVLEALTQPSGNAYEHVDGPEGLAEAMGTLVARLFGQVATFAQVRIQPLGFTSLVCRHAFPSRLDQEALVVTLGDLTGGLPRRVLFSGTVEDGPWSLQVQGSCLRHGDPARAEVEVERVAPGSPRAAVVLGIGHELELVSFESAAWLSLARRDLGRAETQLEEAETHLRAIVDLAPEGVPVRRHLERLGDLRLAVERGEGDIPLLLRRAQSARAGTHVSQVIQLQAYRKK